MGREFELKFAATEEVLCAVEKEFGGFRAIAMATTYYDTPAGDLSRRHITLRQRLENGVCVCTVKTPLPDGSRGEWELAHEDANTMVEVLCGCGAPAQLRELTREGIVPVCGAAFTRLAKTVEGEGWSVELALDRGTLTGGNKNIPLMELEVELKTGEDAAAVAFAKVLAEKYGLRPQPESKFRRAKALAEEI